MIEAGHRPRIRPATTRSELALVSFLRSFDWILLAAAAGLVGYGLWVVSGITRFDVPGAENYFVVRQAAAAALGAVGLIVVALIRSTCGAATGRSCTARPSGSSSSSSWAP